MGVLVISETRVVTMVTPAEGPSFGMAPAGTWIWRSTWLLKSSSKPTLAAFDRTQVSAACMDSCMTSPICPVTRKPPWPFILLASMKRMSPPDGVQARPTATPSTSGSLKDFHIDADLNAPQKLLEDFLVDHQPDWLTVGSTPGLDDAAGLLAADSTEHLLETANAGFAGVVTYEITDGLFRGTR